MAILDPVKQVKAKVTTNIVGSVAGGVGGYFAAKKLGKVTNKYGLIAAVIGGVVAGAYIQSMYAAKASAPKKSDA